MQEHYRERKRWWGAALAAIAALTSACAADPSGSVAQEEMIEGVALSEWTARWWRWADLQDIPPYLDPDGQLCALGQSGPVWFLAGTDGEFQPQRTCTIPEGRHLLLPVINMISYGIDGDESCRTLQDDAAMNNDHLRSAVVTLDGQPLADVDKRRVTSAGCFHMDPHDPDSMLAAADGFWVMLPPLPRGRHTLSVRANYDTRQGGAYSGMQQTFDYVLQIGNSDPASAVQDPVGEQGRSP